MPQATRLGAACFVAETSLLIRQPFASNLKRKEWIIIKVCGGCCRLRHGNNEQWRLGTLGSLGARRQTSLGDAGPAPRRFFVGGTAMSCCEPRVNKHARCNKNTPGSVQEVPN